MEYNVARDESQRIEDTRGGTFCFTVASEELLPAQA
jgi:hypothetical protein